MLGSTYSRSLLEGQFGLITGGAGLLGPRHAIALLEAGASVVLTDVNETALTSASAHLKDIYPKEKIITRVLDVSSSSSVTGVFQDLHSAGITPSILINNAAIDAKQNQISDGTGRLEDISYERWRKEFDVGLYGTFIMCREFANSLLAVQEEGVIVNIASDLSIIAPNQSIYKSEDDLSGISGPVKPVTYCLVKAGVVALTKYLATYWPSETIRINALSPGGVYVGQDPAFVSRLSSLIPLNRMANVDEYQGAIQFLASSMSSYMHGHNLIIDGGRSIW